MEVFDEKVLRKTFRVTPRAKRLFDEKRAALRAERVANPPGPGNLRNLKAQADKDAMQQTYDALASDAAYAEEARAYDSVFSKEHGRAAVRSGS